MILIDTALQKLEQNGTPIRIGMVGAGFMARGVCLQVLRYTKGMRISAIANRSTDNAQRAYKEAGAETVRHVDTQEELDQALEQKIYAVTADPLLLCRSPHIDIIFEVTGTIEHAARVVLEAIKYKKHVVVMNAELDATLGPLLKTYADKAGVVYTNVDGDQPGVEMNLYRFVKSMGITPVLCGNIKGLQDPYRTPTTQAGFAAKWLQRPSMVTSFADGSKISFEQALVANATGMRVAKRGMWAPTVPAGTPLRQAIEQYPVDELLKSGGVVDYIIGPEPNAGVFVLGTMDDSVQKHYFNYYKLGEGPLYLFYNPYHLCHLEIPNTFARAAIFHDAAVTPLGAPSVEVITIAKKDLTNGEVIDGIGCYTVYGECENRDTARSQNLLPLGLAEGARLQRDIKKDGALTFADVQLPQGRLIDELWKKQCEVCI